MKNINVLRGVGPVYWITRDYVPSNAPFLSTGFMRETDYPWRVGKGLQIKVFKRIVQVGVCKRKHYINYFDGELGAIGGRMMDDTAAEIGNW